MSRLKIKLRLPTTDDGSVSASETPSSPAHRASSTLRDEADEEDEEGGAGDESRRERDDSRAVEEDVEEEEGTCRRKSSLPSALASSRGLIMLTTFPCIHSTVRYATLLRLPRRARISRRVPCLGCSRRTKEQSRPLCRGRQTSLGAQSQGQAQVRTAAGAPEPHCRGDRCASSG